MIPRRGSSAKGKWPPLPSGRPWGRGTLEAMRWHGPIGDGPWGARGVGEHVMVQTAPAIANALYDAVGIRFSDLPLSADKIFLTLEDMNNQD